MGVGGGGMVVPIHMTSIFHDNNVEDLMNLCIAKMEFQNNKQSIMEERFVLGNTNGLNI